MKLDPETQVQAETHMAEMVGGSVGIVLLSADNLEQAKANLHAAIDDFPTSMRDILTPEARTYVLQDSTRSIRLHARGLYKILGDLAGARAAEAGKTAEEAREEAMAGFIQASLAAEVPGFLEPEADADH